MGPGGDLGSVATAAPVGDAGLGRGGGGTQSRSLRIQTDSTRIFVGAGRLKLCGSARSEEHYGAPVRRHGAP